MPDKMATHRWVGNFILDFNGKSLEPGDFFSPTEDDLEDPAMKEFVDSGFVLNLSEVKPIEEAVSDAN